MAITNKVNFRWVRKTDSTLGTDTPGDPQIGTSPLNKVLEQLIDNDVDLDSRIGGSLVAHTDTTGIQGTGPEEIHLNSVEKSEYDGLNPRVTSLENSGGGGGSGPSFLNQQVFTSNNSLEVPLDVTKVKITGTGGGGCGNASGVFQGGGAGGTFSGIFNVVPGEIITITIGVGGLVSSELDGGNTTITISGRTGVLTAFGGHRGNNTDPNYGKGGEVLNTLPGLVANSLISMHGGSGSGDGTQGAEGGDSFFGVGGGEVPTVATPKYGGGGTANFSGASGIVVIEYNQPVVITGNNRQIITASTTTTLPTGTPIRFIGIGGGSGGGNSASYGANGGATTLTVDGTTHTAEGGGPGVAGSAGTGGYPGGIAGGNGQLSGGFGGGGSAGGYGGGSSGGFSAAPGGGSGFGGNGGYGGGAAPGGVAGDAVGFGGGGGGGAAAGAGSGAGSFNVVATLVNGSVSISIGSGGAGIIAGGDGYQGALIVEW